jgi:F0F1-type ATP synthase delta subunit
MNGGDSPVLSVYLPEDLTDESVHAISDFLNTISQTFDQMYANALKRPSYSQEDRISTFECEIGDDEDPF